MNFCFAGERASRFAAPKYQDSFLKTASEKEKEELSRRRPRRRRLPAAAACPRRQRWRRRERPSLLSSHRCHLKLPHIVNHPWLNKQQLPIQQSKQLQQLIQADVSLHYKLVLRYQLYCIYQLLKHCFVKQLYIQQCHSLDSAGQIYAESLVLTQIATTITQVGHHLLF